MATIAELNVRIGARINDLEKGLKKAERQLARSGRNLSRLGNDLTLTVTAPLMAIGAAAVSASGKFELLENSLTAMMGSSDAARSEMEKLRKVAQDPGLNFEQAVKGSVRLQAVGLNADLARRALAGFGNAITLAGGTASDLDGVSLALTQIISKGKVSAEEINQLAERVPQIRKAMKDALGTADTEHIQKMGIEAEKFVEIIIGEMEKLPKAQGGLQNSIENLGQSVTLFLSNLGNDINKTFNLQERFEDFGRRLADVADWFAKLDASTKKNILTFGLFAVAMGPAIKVIGVFKSTIAQSINIARGAVGVFGNLSGAALKAAHSLGLVSVSIRHIRAAIGSLAVIGAAAMFISWAVSSDKFSESQNRVRQSVKDAQTEIAKEKVISDRLFETLKDTTKGTNDRREALQELQKRYPQYLSNIDLEKSKLIDIEEAQKLSNAGLIRRVALQKKAIAIDDIAAKMAEKQLRITELRLGAEATLAEIRRTGAKGFVSPEQSRINTISLLTDEIKLLSGEIKSVDELFNKTFETESTGGRRGGRFGGSAFGGFKKEVIPEKEQDPDPIIVKVDTAEVDKAKESFKGFGESFEYIIDGVQQSSAAVPDFIGAIAPISGSVRDMAHAISTVKFYELKEDAAELTQALINQRAEIEATNHKWKEFGEQVEQIVVSGLANSIGDFAAGIGEAIAGVGTGADALKVLVIGLADILVQVGKLAIKTGLAVEGIKKAIESLNPVLAVAGGIALVALGSFIKGKLRSQVPKLAEGGIATAPTLAMVGDNPSGMEAIIPLEKFPQIFGSMDNGSGQMGGTLTAKVQGSDLLFVLQQAEENRRRRSGF